jgi:hypothetical protein
MASIKYPTVSLETSVHFLRYVNSRLQFTLPEIDIVRVVSFKEVAALMEQCFTQMHSVEHTLLHVTINRCIIIIIIIIIINFVNPP